MTTLGHIPPLSSRSFLTSLIGRQLLKILSCEGVPSQVHLQSIQIHPVLAPSATIQRRQRRKSCHPNSRAVTARLHTHNDHVRDELVAQDGYTPALRGLGFIFFLNSIEPVKVFVCIFISDCLIVMCDCSVSFFVAMKQPALFLSI